MMWSDKAFGIWMGHAGEDTQVFTQDEPAVSAAGFEHTQVLAIARREVTPIELAPRSRSQQGACEPEGMAA